MLNRIEKDKTPHTMKVFSLVLLLILVVPAPLAETSESYEFQTVASGLDHPWSLAILPDGSMLLAELSGHMRIVGRDGSLGEPLRNVPEVIFAGQGGLSDIILSPDFSETQRFYFSYSAPGSDDGSPTLFVVSAVLGEGAIEEVEVIFEAHAPRSAAVHFGAKLALAPDGSLFITSGDGFDFREEAQELDNHFGKVLRINTDGSVPDDNPFVGKEGALPEIWSYGHRNQQGLLFTPDGTLYEHEHGPRGGDELNKIEKGANYGWPLVCHCLDYSFAFVTPFEEAPGLEKSLFHWTPSIAPSGFAFYTGDAFPEWKDSFLVSALLARDVRRVYKQGDTYSSETLFAELGERIRNVYQAPDGSLILLTDSSDGAIIRVLPSNDQQ